MAEIVLGAGVFTAVVMTLVLLILAARRVLVPSGDAGIVVNGRPAVPVALGESLLRGLSAHGIHLPSACGGRGTCGQCRVTVREGGRPPLPVEASLLARRELREGVRLACQLTVRGDLRLEVPSESIGVGQWQCRVRSTRSVTTLMKEIVLELPAGEALSFRAGAYVQVTCPPHETRFTRIEVAPEYAGEWERLGLRRLAVASRSATTRAYSLANPPADADVAMLVVRIALPPPGTSVPPGVVSTWLFALRPGDPVEVTGPFGTFHVEQNEREMMFVGGGAGMAPMRAIIRDELLGRGTTRPMTFWYGARNRRELCYADEFDALAAAHENFRWTVALSEPRPEDDWQGETGLIHQVLERDLRAHPAPESCDWYLCGPPMMARAVLRVLAQRGVPREQVRFDDFGS